MPCESTSALAKWEECRQELARLESLCAAAVVLHATGQGPSPDDLQDEIAALRRQTALLYDEALKSVARGQ